MSFKRASIAAALALAFAFAGAPASAEPAGGGGEGGAHSAHPIGLPAEAINWGDFGYAGNEEYEQQFHVGMGPPIAALLLNFLILVGLIYFAARKPISKMLKERSDKVREGLAEAQRMLEEANERLADYSARLERMDEEMTRLREEFIAAGVAERDRLVADGGAKAERMRRDAEVRLTQELSQLREELRVELVEKAVEVATEQLSKQVNEDDQRRLADEYAKRLEQEGLGQ